MKDMGIVQGSAAQALPLIIGTDTVYIHTDIKKLCTDSEGNPTNNLYEYHEIQCTKDEYLIIANSNVNVNYALSSFNAALLEDAINGIETRVKTLESR